MERRPAGATRTRYQRGQGRGGFRPPGYALLDKGLYNSEVTASGGKGTVTQMSGPAPQGKGTRTVLSMQNSYAGPPENFAMVVPVPVVLKPEKSSIIPVPR